MPIILILNLLIFASSGGQRLEPALALSLTSWQGRPTSAVGKESPENRRSG
jgi:hypothetical protein